MFISKKFICLTQIWANTNFNVIKRQPQVSVLLSKNSLFSQPIEQWKDIASEIVLCFCTLFKLFNILLGLDKCITKIYDMKAAAEGADEIIVSPFVF